MLRRAACIGVALTLVISCTALLADTVLYTGDAAGSGPTATFSYQVTTSGVLTIFDVEVWAGARASEFTNFTDPGGFTPSFVQDLDGNPGNGLQPGIRWTGGSLIGTGTFGFDNTGGWVPDSDASTWTSNSGSGPQSGTTRGPVPEPATLLLFGSGLVGLALLKRRQARK